jgi:hypothetical protein
VVQYSQKRVTGVDDLELKYVREHPTHACRYSLWPMCGAGGWRGRLAEIGGRVGVRVLELLVLREKNLKRETRIVGILTFISTNVFRALFGKAADSLERSNDRDNECM